MVGLANDLNISEPGYVIHNGMGVFHGRTFQAGTGISLTNADGISGNTTIALSGSSVLTLTGNDLTPESPSAGNFNLLTANSTVKFAGTAATETLDFALSNLFLGSSLPSLSGATFNCGFGIHCGESIIASQQTTLMGAFCGQKITTSVNNSAYGYGSLGVFTTGAGNAGANTCFGAGSLGNLLTGVLNFAFGAVAGSNYSGAESSNIVIGSTGTVGDSNTIRIGTQGSSGGQQNRSFMAGVTGVTVASSAPIAVDINGQLSSLGTGTLGQILISTGTTSPTWQSSAALSTPSAVFGDGSDGLQTFDGSTVILGLTPSGNTYTLLRDIFLGTSTINNGVSIITNGFRMFCNGTLTNNGTIKYNGNNGLADGTAGAVLSNNTSSINPGGTTSAYGTAGGAGNVGAGSNGVTGAGATIGAFGGTGGTGGTGGSAGGTGGTLTVLPAAVGSIRSIPWSTVGYTFNAGTYTKIQGGAGGGGGGGDGAAKGGGGGSGGGIVLLVSLFIAGTGSIQARGGNGGTPTAGTNCGGGASGGGGLVLLTSRSIVSGAISGQTIDAATGTPGSGFGSGASGGSGNGGTVILIAG